MDKKPEEVNEEEINFDFLDIAKEWRKNINDDIDSLEKVSKNILSMADSIAEMFEEVKKSSRTKYVYGPQLAESASSLYKQYLSSRKEHAMLTDKRMTSSLKLREFKTMLDSMEKSDSEEINPVDFLKKIANIQVE